MPIKFACPHCRKVLNVKDQLAGKRGACPNCKKMIQVPAAAVTAAAPKPPSQPAVDLEALAAAALTGPRERAAGTTIDFTCPFCDSPIKVSADLEGRQTPCPNPECRRIVKVPLLEKAGPRDWRQPDVQKGPSGARREDIDVEGAWSTGDKARVSREALLEADVIQEIREPITLREWTRYAVAAAILIGGGAWLLLWWLNSRERRLEERVVEGIGLYLEGPAAQNLSTQHKAELERLVAEYHTLANRADAKGRTARGHLQLARDAAAAIVPEPERVAVFVQLFRTQIAAGLQPTKPDLDKYEKGEVTYVEEEVGRELGRTLHQLSTAPVELRHNLVRELARHGVKAGKAEVVQNILTRAGTPPTKPDTKDPDHSELISYLSILGQELAAAGQHDAAGQIATHVAGLYAKHQRPGHRFPRDFIALLAMVNQQHPKQVGEHRLDQANGTRIAEAMQAGEIEGRVRAKQLTASADVCDRLQASKLNTLLGCAEALIHRGDGATPLLETVRGILQNAPPADTIWQRQRLVELAATSGDTALARQLADAAIKDSAIPLATQAYCRLAILRAELDKAPKEEADPAKANDIDSQASAHAVAIALIARHNARLDPAKTEKWAESVQPDTVKPFALVGIALAMRDRQKK